VAIKGPRPPRSAVASARFNVAPAARSSNPLLLCAPCRYYAGHPQPAQNGPRISDVIVYRRNTEEHLTWGIEWAADDPVSSN